MESGVHSGPMVRSFTQRRRFGNELALFALANVDDTDYTVFHCHGRYNEVDSVIASEADYQKWYMGDPEGAGPPVFRQTIDLLFSSNPILFVGYGLADDDLLRPLRMLQAVDLTLREAKPLVALIEEPAEGEDWIRHEILFERYGRARHSIHTAPAERPRLWAAALCASLRRPATRFRRLEPGLDRQAHHEEGSGGSHSGQSYRHYAVDPDTENPLGDTRVREQLTALRTLSPKAPS